MLSGIKEDIDSSFGSVRQVLVAVDGSLRRLLVLHSTMSAEVTSLQGMLYYVCVFIVTGVTASWAGHAVRVICWTVLGVNAGL